MSPSERALVLVVGQPAAGKSTFMAASGDAVVSFGRGPNRVARARREIAARWEAGGGIVYTDIRCRTARSRVGWIAWARLRGAGVRAVHVVCDDAERHNRLRARGIAPNRLAGWTLLLDAPREAEGIDAIQVIDTSCGVAHS